jgi:putative endonuclease
MDRTYCVYILASRSRNLYTGVTGNLEPRMIEHRQGLIPGFTTWYRIFRLVYFEYFSDVRAAIAREKEIKGWRREKKIWLIKRDKSHLGRFGGKNSPPIPNAKWRKPQSEMTKTAKQIPHRRSPKTGDRVRDDALKKSIVRKSAVTAKSACLPRAKRETGFGMTTTGALSSCLLSSYAILPYY